MSTFISHCTRKLVPATKSLIMAQYHDKVRTESQAAANVFLSTASTVARQEQHYIDQKTIHLSGSIQKFVCRSYYDNYTAHGRTYARQRLEQQLKGRSQKKAFSIPAEKYAFECQEVIRLLGVEGGKQFFHDQHLAPPQGETENSTIARMLDPYVWEKKLKKRNKQRTETVIRNKGHIYRDGQPYASDWNVTGFIAAQQDSQAYLARQCAISSEGDELTLMDIAKTTVANPYNRHSEMMTRISGIETVAKNTGMICLFINPTAPSKYHRKRFIKGIDKDCFINNPRYQTKLEVKQPNGEIQSIPNTPQQSHAYIKRTIARCIAKLKRQKIDYMGYKVVEPNHDGTVHWHMAFFVPPEHKETVCEIFTHYALQEDGDEKGAKQHRMIIKDHDPKQGSVTGYMAKYISKGIAGFGIDTDVETGMNADDAVIRIMAWKSTWNIRQFAFYGSPSVSVWRELRRLRTPLANPTAEKARLAADEGKWDVFINLMKQHSIKLLKSALIDADGHEKKNAYGEVVKRVSGLQLSGLSVTMLSIANF